MPKLPSGVVRKINALPDITPERRQEFEEYRRLEEERIANEEQEARVNTAPRNTTVEAALALADEGWNVFPLRGKLPAIGRAHHKGYKCRGECGDDGHGAYDGTQDSAKIQRWFRGVRGNKLNIGSNLGEDLIAFDVDLKKAGLTEEAVEHLPFPPTRTHLTGRGGGNRHLIYRFEPGSLASQIKGSTHTFADCVDVRIGMGQYIAMPPSIHPDTRKPYTLDEASPGIHLITDAEVLALFEADNQEPPSAPKAAKRKTTAKERTKRAKQNKGSTTRLSDLLENPPARGEGKTNEWLAAVAGHYAKQYRNKRDLYDYHLRAAVDLVDSDYEDYDKTAESVWDTEHGSHRERDATMENGYLVGDGTRMFVQTKMGDTDPEMSLFADFDLQCFGIDYDVETEEAVFAIRVNTPHERTFEKVLPTKVLSDTRKFSEWATKFGLPSEIPPHIFPKCLVSEFGRRMLRYLLNQNPPRIKVVHHYGWHDDVGFVTPEGVINDDGLVESLKAGILVDVKEADVSHTYGFSEDEDEARRVLREVLTFQKDVVTSPFGAWWAACFLKPQIMQQQSLFPAMGVEAPSGSGKTNGFFSHMMQLNGSVALQSTMTAAALRDRAITNASGVLWVDDMNSVTELAEVIRAITSGGTMTKYDRENFQTKAARLVSPLFLSGESLGFGDEKALLDRTIELTASSPIGRRSLHDGNQSQWVDIEALQARYPKNSGGLAMLAGWYVQMALRWRDETLGVISDYRRENAGGGRVTEKFAVLMGGACLLDAMTGAQNPFERTGPHAIRVLKWIKETSRTADLPKDNTVTIKLLPWAIRMFGEGALPMEGLGRLTGLMSPVLAWEDNKAHGFRVLVRPADLSDAVRREWGNRTNERTESEASIRQQLKALGATSMVKTLDGKSQRWIELPKDYAQRVMDRVRGNNIPTDLTDDVDSELFELLEDGDDD